jgi:D-glucosaminate-6-phosphate ammonia-lyase
MSGKDISGPFSSLGLKRIINAADTYSVLGGSVMDSAVREAMAAAGSAYVSMDALQDKVGARIAEITRTQAACVTAGAAAGLAMAAAAIVTANDPAAILALPEVPQRHRMVIHRCQRMPYDQAIRMVGVELVEIGMADKTYVYELEAALKAGASAVIYIAGDMFERFALPLPEVAEVAKRFGVPLIVDAAAQLPPMSNLWAYTEQGADLVVFSGGKGLRGPQASGILAGRADLVAACRANMSPRHAFGRAMKVGREQIIGLLAALEQFILKDWVAIEAGWEADVARICTIFNAMPGITAERIYPGRMGQSYPRALIRWDEARGPTRAQLLDSLQRGDPEIHVGTADDNRPGIAINPFVLTDAAELDQVITRVMAELRA